MAITFENAAHQFTHERARALLEQLELSPGVSDQMSMFVLKQGSTYVKILTFALNERFTFIRVIAYLVEGARVDDPELLSFILKKNGDIGLGALGVTGKYVYLKYDMPGLTCTAAELRAAIHSVALIGDELDDEICQRWGGKRAIEPPADASASPDASP